MGKDRGDDFREGKMTLPVIFAYARGDADERRFWQEAIAGFRTEDEDLAQATQLIRRHGAIGATRERARHFAERACDALSMFPHSRARLCSLSAAVASLVTSSRSQMPVLDVSSSLVIVESYEVDLPIAFLEAQLDQRSAVAGPAEAAAAARLVHGAMRRA